MPRSQIRLIFAWLLCGAFIAAGQAQPMGTVAADYQLVPYVVPLGGGDSMVWDFRNMDFVGKDYPIQVDSLPDGSFMVFEHLTHYHIGDSIDYQNNARSFVDYIGSGKAVLRYSIVDSLTCRDTVFNDASGVLRLPEFNTKVVRQHRVLTLSPAHHPDMQLTLEACTWFHRQYHWPLLSSVCVKNRQGKVNFQTSLIHLLPDSVAERIAIEWHDEEPSAKDLEPHNSITVYPNPTPDWLYLQLHSSEDGQAEIAVYNASGKNVHEQTDLLTQGDNLLTIDLQNLSSGYYILSVKTFEIQHQCIIVKN